jgi:hypothetical protein
LRKCSYNILNHSKWRRIEKDLPKCLVIGKQLVMGQFTLAYAKNGDQQFWKPKIHAANG